MIGSRRKRGGAAKSQSNNNHPTPSNLPTSAASTSTASVSTSRTSKEATNKQLQQKLCDRDQTISRLKKNIDIAKELSRADVSNISILNSTSAFFIYLYFHRCVDNKIKCSCYGRSPPERCYPFYGMAWYWR